MSTLKVILYGLAIVVILPLYLAVGAFSYIARYRHFQFTVSAMTALINKARNRSELPTLLLFGAGTWASLILWVRFVLHCL